MYVSDGAHYYGILIVDCCEYKTLAISTPPFLFLIVVNKLLLFHHEHVPKRPIFTWHPLHTLRYGSATKVQMCSLQSALPPNHQLQWGQAW